MDKVDFKILSALQGNGRLSSQALAEKVGLSSSPCWRRVRRLEEAGVIQATVALVDAAQVGLHVTAIAMVSLEDHHPDSVAEFDRVVQERPEILECHATSGQHDYTLKVVCASIQAYALQGGAYGQHLLCVAFKQVHDGPASLTKNRLFTGIQLLSG